MFPCRKNCYIDACPRSLVHFYLTIITKNVRILEHSILFICKSYHLRLFLCRKFNVQLMWIGSLFPIQLKIDTNIWEKCLFLNNLRRTKGKFYSQLSNCLANSKLYLCFKRRRKQIGKFKDFWEKCCKSRLTYTFCRTFCKTFYRYFCILGQKFTKTSFYPKIKNSKKNLYMPQKPSIKANLCYSRLF